LLNEAIKANVAINTLNCMDSLLASSG